MCVCVCVCLSLSLSFSLSLSIYIIMSRHQHGYPGLFLVTLLYPHLLPATGLHPVSA